MLIQSLDSSVKIQWNYNVSNGTEYFYVYCKATYQQYQSSFWYSKTILYNGNNTFNTSITGLLPNTTYTCCVLAVTSYGESEPECQNNITTNVTSKYTDFMYCSCVLCDHILHRYNLLSYY